MKMTVVKEDVFTQCFLDIDSTPFGLRRNKEEMVYFFLTVFLTQIGQGKKAGLGPASGIILAALSSRGLVYSGLP